MPTVTGVLGWHALSIGDPAQDLQWLAAAPLASDTVYEAYAAGSLRAPDGLLRERARLHAELEFASWLVHGIEDGHAEVVDDAVALLASLAGGIGADDVVPPAATDVRDAIALLERVPDAAAPTVDTSMQTDAYDPEMLSAYLAAERDGDGEAADAAPVSTAPDIAAAANRTTERRMPPSTMRRRPPRSTRRRSGRRRRLCAAGRAPTGRDPTQPRMTMSCAT